MNTNQTPVQNFLSRLDSVKQRGKYWQACCPAHNDKNASLSVAVGRDGRVLVKCHAGCPLLTIVAATGLSLSDLMPLNGRVIARSPRIETIYSYTDEVGNPLYQVVRLVPKSFLQRRPDGRGGYIYNMNGIRRVLYRLSDVINAAGAGQTVMIVEGEKDVETLYTHDIVATTNVGGAGKWNDEYSKALRGANVVIIPDNDEPGREHARLVAKSVYNIAASIRILELPDLPSKSDVSDWLNAHGTIDELHRLIAVTPEWKPETGFSDSQLSEIPLPYSRSKNKLTQAAQRIAIKQYIAQFRMDFGPDTVRDVLVDELTESSVGSLVMDEPKLFVVGEFLRIVGTPPPMAIDRLIPANSLTLLSGKPKSGKTFAALDLAYSVAVGELVFGEFLVNEPGSVCYLAFEDGQYEIANRLLKRGLRAGSDTPLHVCTTRFTLSTPQGVAVLEKLVAPIAPRLIVVDTGREGLALRDWNDAGGVSDALRSLREFARRTCPVILVAHNRKADGADSGDEVSGSNALTSSVDGWLSVTKIENVTGGNRRLHITVNGRANMRGSFVAEMDSDTLRFKTVSAETYNSERADANRDAKMTRIRALVTIIRNIPGDGATVSEIVTMSGKTDDSIRLTIKEAITEGFLEKLHKQRQPEGGGRPADSFRTTPYADSLFSDSSYSNRISENRESENDSNYGEEEI